MKTILSWALVYFMVALGTAFLHQSAHGLGALLDGGHISTGFATAGDYGKKPSDSDYRSTMPILGRLNSGGFLGPFANWLVAILSTLLLYRLKEKNTTYMVVGALALSNALIRVFPVLAFLGAVVTKRLWLDDEATWALATIPELNCPTTFPLIEQFVKLHPEIVIQEPRVYFWPLVSLFISVFCLCYSMPRFYEKYREDFKSKIQFNIFVLAPIWLGVPIFAAAKYLDEIVRINW